jgi:hypothetical protein
MKTLTLSISKCLSTGHTSNVNQTSYRPNQILDETVFLIASGVGLSPLHCGHFWHIVPAPDDR